MKKWLLALLVALPFLAQAEVIPGKPKPGTCTIDTGSKFYSGLFLYVPFVTSCNVDNLARVAATGTRNDPTNTTCQTDSGENVLEVGDSGSGGQYIYFAEDAVAGLLPDNAFTIISHVKPNGAAHSTRGGLFEFYGNPNATTWGSITMDLTSANEMKCTAGRNAAWVLSSATLTDDVWSDVACAYDKDEGGAEQLEVWVGSASPDSGVAYSDSIIARVGDRYDVGSYYYASGNDYQNMQGRYLYMAAWNRKLSDSDISEFMGNPWAICEEGASGPPMALFRRGRGR